MTVVSDYIKKEEMGNIYTEIVNGGREFVGLTERTEDGDFVTKDLARWPCDAVLAAVHAVHDELSTSSDIVDGVLEDLDAAGSLDDNVEAVWVLGLQLLELRGWVLSGEGNVLIRSVEGFSQVHLETFRCSNDDVATTILAKQLCQHETRRSRTEHEHPRTHLGSNLVQTVGRTRRRFEQGGINVGKVLDVEHSLGRVGTVLGKATVHGDTVGLEVLTEKLLPTTAVEAFSAKLRVVGTNAVADLESLDLGSNIGNDTDSLVAGDQRELHGRQQRGVFTTSSGVSYLGQEFTLVDMQVGTTNTAGLDLDLFPNCQPSLSIWVDHRPSHTKTSCSRSLGRGTSTTLNFSGSSYSVFGQHLVKHGLRSAYSAPSSWMEAVRNPC